MGPTADPAHPAHPVAAGVADRVALAAETAAAAAAGGWEWPESAAVRPAMVGVGSMVVEKVGSAGVYRFPGADHAATGEYRPGSRADSGAVPMNAGAYVDPVDLRHSPELALAPAPAEEQKVAAVAYFAAGHGALVVEDAFVD